MDKITPPRELLNALADAIVQTEGISALRMSAWDAAKALAYSEPFQKHLASQQVNAEAKSVEGAREPVTVQVHVEVPLERDDAARVISALPDGAVIRIERPASLLPAAIAPSVVVARWEEQR